MPGGPCIEWKELFAVYLVLREIAPSLEPDMVVVATMNIESNAFSSNNGHAWEETPPLLALILKLAFVFNVRLLGDWIPRFLNLLCDLLSRFRPLPGLEPGPSLAAAPAMRAGAHRVL